LDVNVGRQQKVNERQCGHHIDRVVVADAEPARPQHQSQSAGCSCCRGQSVTAFLEAGWIWIYQGFEPEGMLANNFSLDLGISAAWQCLATGLLIAVVAVIRQTPRPQGGLQVIR
jgi:hypothetical protein